MRDKYHPHMVDYPLERRMRATGHTAKSVQQMLAPYQVEISTINRWRKLSRVPYTLQTAITLGLNRNAPPPPKWTDFDLRRARTAKRISRRFLAMAVGVNPSAIIEWDERHQVPTKHLADVKKILARCLTPKKKEININLNVFPDGE